MPTISVLLLMTLMPYVAGMCFDNTKASSPREVVKPAHVVGSIEGCKTACWSSAACLAFSYNPISSKCALLGAVKDGICAGKGFYPYVKCAATVNCDYLSDDSASFAKGGGSIASPFPRCQLNTDFVATEVCGTHPPEIICENLQCFCKDPKQQLVVKSGSLTYCGVRAHCNRENKFTLLSPNGQIQSLLFPMSDAVCTTITGTTYPKCMCDLPFSSDGIRDGDKLCGSKKMKSWSGTGPEELFTNLSCTPNGWSDGAKIVKPQHVVCE